MKHLPLLLALLCACRAVPAEPVPDGPARTLLAADRAFCADVQARRLEGWLAAFDEHGSQVDAQFRPITGHAAIRANMQPFFADATQRLVWEPDAARISEGGNLGSTTGRFRMARVAPDGSEEVLLSGRYFDVWRRLPDGTWKLLYDLGEPDPAPSKPR